MRKRLVGGGREGQVLASRRLWNCGYDWSRVVLLRRDRWGEVPALEVEEDGEGCLAGTVFRSILWLGCFWASDGRRNCNELILGGGVVLRELDGSA